MRDGFIRKKVQKVVSKTGVQITMPHSHNAWIGRHCTWRTALVPSADLDMHDVRKAPKPI